jgi:hypothetical protein
MGEGEKPLVWLHGEIKTPRRTDPDAVVILDVLKKKSRTTPETVIETCKRRLAEYDRLA